MSSTIKANVTSMFRAIEPCYVSGSQNELGSSAGRVTWLNALRIAERAPEWLESPANEADDAIRAWARDTGAWERDEIEAWSQAESLALFAQNVAADLRKLGWDNESPEVCIGEFELHAKFGGQPEEVTGWYRLDADNTVHVDYYTGV